MNIVRVAALCAVTAVAACHGDSGTPPSAPATPRPSAPMPKKGPSAADQITGMVDATSGGKSDLAVSLKFDIKQRPVLGQPLTIDIAVLPQIDAIDANVEVTGTDGITSSPGANQFSVAPVEAGQVYRHSIQVVPAADGLLLLGLTVSLKRGDMTESRAFSIPLIVEH